MKLAAALLIAAAVTAPAFAADQTQIFNTQAGAVRITPIYHATARIQAGRDIIYIDPAKPAKIEGMTAGDLILVTDIHGDHMDAADITALSKNGTQVNGTPVRGSLRLRDGDQLLIGTVPLTYRTSATGVSTETRVRAISGS